MSQDFNDPEIFADFIIESKEHLETIEPNLLELEKAPENLALLNEIFRPMHSLKGASGFLGLNRINVLAHRAENVLDELRKGSMAVNSEIMDIILSATDALRQMIESLEANATEGDVETESIIARLDGIMAGEMPTAASAAAPAPAAPAPAAQAAPTPVASASAGAVNPSDWMASRPLLPAYTLTSFGQDHLKDFIDEARENITNISDGLLMLERNPGNQAEIVNDTFRFFHNIKGNSGIIGYQEVNKLTHEAETLLNQVRKGEMPVSSGLVDLLLLVSDALDKLFARIDIASAQVTPFDASELLAKLQQATAGGPIELPAGLGNDAAPAPASAPAAPAVVSGAANSDVESFKETVAQQFAGIKSALDGLKANGSDTALADALYRSLDTIKNSAGHLGLGEIKVYAKRTAGIVEQGRKTNMDFSVMVDLLEQECGIIDDMVKQALKGLASAPVAPAAAPAAQAAPQAAAPATPKAEAPKAGPAKPTASPAAASKAPAKDESSSKSSSTIRVDHEKLDHLMQLIGELIINRNRYTMIARELETQEKVDVTKVAQDLAETTYSMGRISDDLQDTIMKVRMLPVSSVFSRFPRLVRDLSRKSGKEVELVTEGEETELDKSVVEAIGDPLVHLIRNSVDHGIEDAETRKAAGKNPIGKVYLRAYHRGNSVAIEIEDDGKGIDPKKMREVAVKKGIATQEEVNALDDREAVELIFAPGFSGAEKVTDISGRGVGMDVVRTNIKNLKGTVNIATEVGKGSTFTLMLPLTLAIIDALMVNVDGATYAIPLDAVSETTKIESERLTDVKGRKAVTLRGEVLGIVSLAELLGLKSNMDEQEVLSVVIIQDNDRHLGLVVDRLLERQEVVIKPLGAYLGDVKGISGATIMGDGSVILIMDPHELYLMATSKAL